MFEQQRLGEDRSSAAGEQQLGSRRDEMDGKNDQITHAAMLTNRVGGASLGSSRCLCDKFEFATHKLKLLSGLTEIPQSRLLRQALQLLFEKYADVHGPPRTRK